MTMPPSDTSTPYLLYYWPFLPGRGEFVRLVLERAEAAYVDIARQPADVGGGSKALLEQLGPSGPGLCPLAPPILVDGDLRLAQMANICAYLGERHGLAPEDAGGRAEAMQLQLTLADLIAEIHATHHPVATGQYYEDQKSEALRCAQHFVDQRLGKYLSYFERVLERGHLVGGQLSYVDLSMNQVLRGLDYAFGRAMQQLRPQIPGLLALSEAVEADSRIAAYRASDRWLPFNVNGIFRAYPELDLMPGSA